MAGSFDDNYDQDLPWDPFWEYVLGDKLESCDPQPLIRLPKRKKQVDEPSLADSFTFGGDSRDEPGSTRSFLSLGKRDESFSGRSRKQGNSRNVERDKSGTDSIESLSQLVGLSAADQDSASKNSNRVRLKRSSKREPADTASIMSFGDSLSDLVRGRDSESDGEKESKTSENRGFWRRNKSNMVKTEPKAESSKRNSLGDSLSILFSPSSDDDDSVEAHEFTDRPKKALWKRKSKDNVHDLPEKNQAKSFEESLADFFDPLDEEDTSSCEKASKKKLRFWRRKKRDPDEVEKDNVNTYSFEDAVLDYLDPEPEEEVEVELDESKMLSKKRKRLLFWRRKKNAEESQSDDDNAQLQTTVPGNSFEDSISDFFDPKFESSKKNLTKIDSVHKSKNGNQGSSQGRSKTKMWKMNKSSSVLVVGQSASMSSRRDRTNHDTIKSQGSSSSEEEQQKRPTIDKKASRPEEKSRSKEPESQSSFFAFFMGSSTDDDDDEDDGNPSSSDLESGKGQDSGIEGDADGSNKRKAPESESRAMSEIRPIRSFIPLSSEDRDDKKRKKFWLRGTRNKRKDASLNHDASNSSDDSGLLEESTRLERKNLRRDKEQEPKASKTSQIKNSGAVLVSVISGGNNSEKKKNFWWRDTRKKCEAISLDQDSSEDSDDSGHLQSDSFLNEARNSKRSKPQRVSNALQNTSSHTASQPAVVEEDLSLPRATARSKMKTSLIGKDSMQSRNSGKKEVTTHTSKTLDIERSSQEAIPGNKLGFFSLESLLGSWNSSTDDDESTNGKSSLEEETTVGEASQFTEDTSVFTNDDISTASKSTYRKVAYSDQNQVENDANKGTFAPGSLLAILEEKDDDTSDEGKCLRNDKTVMASTSNPTHTRKIHPLTRRASHEDSLGVQEERHLQAGIDVVDAESNKPVPSASSKNCDKRQLVAQEDLAGANLSILRPKTLLCRSQRSLSDDQFDFGSGVQFQELSSDELARIFPKVCTVVDQRAEVIGNAHSFDDSIVPAHLQASLPRRVKPQSVFEYEYETGRHLFVSYSAFGPDARALIKLGAAPVPVQGDKQTGTALIQVEASTVSQTDCLVRHGLWWGSNTPTLPNIPGADMAGIIYRIDKETSDRFRLNVGDRVVTLTGWGGNSRFLVSDASKLVKVPNNLDPSQVTCLPEVYLSAFQVLHHGIAGARRYRRNALKGKNILLVGPIEPNTARALAQLAMDSGADSIYVLTRRKYFDSFETIGITPLNRDSYDWYESLKKRIDCIISYEEEVPLNHAKLLDKDGKIVLVTSSELMIDEPIHLGPVKKVVCNKMENQQDGRTLVYDVFKEWESPDRLELCKKDIRHLIDLLAAGVISPRILDRIPLSKVAKAQAIVEDKRLTGFIVCEPWLVGKTRAVRL